MPSSSIFSRPISNVMLSATPATFAAASPQFGATIGALTPFDPGVIVQPLPFPRPSFPQPLPFPFPQPLPFPFPQPQPQPQPQPPASPTASASDLQVMIASIPVAQDGHVITSDYHNALRLALVAIANRLGLGTIAEEITITNAPILTFDGAVRGWEQNYGTVRKPTDAEGNVHGWMELELPDGARIKRMVVYGAKTGSGTLTVQLRRQSITNPATSARLIEFTIGDADPAHGVDGDVTLPGTGAGAAAIEEFRIVNNREHKYLFVAELNDSVAATVAALNAVQVVCGR
jgi:hypothetical protein